MHQSHNIVIFALYRLVSDAAPSSDLIFEGGGSVGAWAASRVAALLGSTVLEVGACKMWRCARAVKQGVAADE